MEPIKHVCQTLYNNFEHDMFDLCLTPQSNMLDGVGSCWIKFELVQINFLSNIVQHICLRDQKQDTISLTSLHCNTFDGAGYMLTHSCIKHNPTRVKFANTI